MTDRRRDPAINRAMRALNLPPLLTGSEPDEDAEPMGQNKARLVVASYGLVFGFGLLCIGALHEYVTKALPFGEIHRQPSGAALVGQCPHQCQWAAQRASRRDF